MSACHLTSNRIPAILSSMLKEARDRDRYLAARVVYEVVRRKGFFEVWNEIDEEYRQEIGKTVEEIIRKERSVTQW